MWGHKMKRFEISYNPYSNRIHFRVAVPIDEESVSDWRELPSESIFVDYQNDKCVFEYCVERLLNLINKYINTTERLEILFKGTSEDFQILENAVRDCNDPGAKKITCIHSEVYQSSDISLERIKDAFAQIERDFEYYYSNYEVDGEINDAYLGYKETVKPEIPICIIGPHSDGKSTLVNALAGIEILPSQANGISSINQFCKIIIKIYFRKIMSIDIVAK